MSDNSVYLEKHDPAENQHRFYRIAVHQDLFGQWTLIQEWGRVGQIGKAKTEVYETLEAAQAGLRKKEQEKLQRHYHHVGSAS